MRVRAWLFGIPSPVAEVELETTAVVDLAINISPAADSASRPGRILGRISDLESERPIEGALLALPGVGRQMLSDGQGFFLLADVPPGEHRLEVSHLAYRGLVEVVEVPPGRTVDATIRLVPQAIELEPIVLTLVRHPKLEVHGFYERKEWGERMGNGVFVTRTEIERRNPQRLSHLFQTIPGVLVACQGGIGHCYVFMTRGQGITGDCRQPNIYLDGVKVVRDNQPEPEPIDQLVLPLEVAGIEVYRGAAELPGEYSGADARCGAILIWTR